MAVQADLMRGSDGIDKPLSCSAAQLAKVAQLRMMRLEERFQISTMPMVPQELKMLGNLEDLKIISATSFISVIGASG